MTFTREMQNPGATAPVTGLAFRPIPTRIRDLREPHGVPPLVVEPPDRQLRSQVGQALDELGAKLAEVHRTAAEAYMSQGDHERALPHLESAVLLMPTESEFLHKVGFVRYVTGDDVGAIDAFNAVLAADGKNSEAWFNLGMVLFGQNQHTEAEECFGRSLANNPGDAETWNNRGVCLHWMGRADDARSCFHRALQIDPNDVDARFNLGTIG